MALFRTGGGAPIEMKYTDNGFDNVRCRDAYMVCGSSGNRDCSLNGVQLTSLDTWGIQGTFLNETYHLGPLDGTQTIVANGSARMFYVE